MLLINPTGCVTTLKWHTRVGNLTTSATAQVEAQLLEVIYDITDATILGYSHPFPAKQESHLYMCNRLCIVQSMHMWHVTTN